jgi:hypothetical protein
MGAHKKTHRVLNHLDRLTHSGAAAVSVTWGCDHCRSFVGLQERRIGQLERPLCFPWQGDVTLRVFTHDPFTLWVHTTLVFGVRPS